MKYRLMLVLFFAGIVTVSAQTRPTAVDKSPMDMSYYPCNYPVLRIQNKITEPLCARVVYSRPQKNGRTVFGELVEYGKIWRLGANEATEIELYRDAVVKGNKLKKGRYTMYAIPTTEKWTVIFNKETDIWGAFRYDETKDVLRVDISPETVQENAEAFTIVFEKAANGANLLVHWDNVKASIPFIF